MQASSMQGPAFSMGTQPHPFTQPASGVVTGVPANNAQDVMESRAHAPNPIPRGQNETARARQLRASACLPSRHDLEYVAGTAALIAGSVSMTLGYVAQVPRDHIPSVVPIATIFGSIPFLAGGLVLSLRAHHLGSSRNAQANRSDTAANTQNIPLTTAVISPPAQTIAENVGNARASVADHVAIDMPPLNLSAAAHPTAPAYPR